jgi:hypothetical protein
MRSTDPGPQRPGSQRLGMGCWAIAGRGGTRTGLPRMGEVDDAESVRAIHTALWTTG